MQVMRVSLEMPWTDENASPLQAMFGGQTKLLIGTEVMVDSEEEAKEQGEEFNGLVTAFLTGWKESVDENT